MPTKPPRKPGSGGHNKKSVEQHQAEGTYRADRHGPVTVEVPPMPPIPPRPKLHHKPELPIDFDDLIEQGWDDDVETYLDKYAQTDLSEEYARRWVWDESDELAIHNGCRFDLKRALHFAKTCQLAFRVWEGEHAGDPMILRGWQPEFCLRLYGWVRPRESQVMPWVRRYSKACVWVNKKNGKTPIAAACGNYEWRFRPMWRVDGMRQQSGAHIYTIARNGKQAQLLHRHAWLMATHSPLLVEEFANKVCQYHKTSRALTHHPSHSTYEILTGDGPQSMKAGEGLNAQCIVCDEAHVVTQEQVDVCTDSGASNPEFIWLQISTSGAGDGYGKRSRDYGQAVAEGRIKDDRYLHKDYGLPEGTSDEDCGKLENWIRANPMWTFTVQPPQFADAYNRAKQDPVAFSGFKQRRLGIWQESSNPMISTALWQAGKTDLRLEDFRGQCIAGGLDLAAVGDFCALALAFKTEDDVVRLWLKFWCADRFIKKYSDCTPCAKWTEGDISVHTGEVHLPQVQTEVAEILEEYEVEVLGFDQMFATQMAQSLREETGCKVVSFPQSMRAYANGTALFLRALRNKRLRHAGQPVLDWMASVVQVKQQGDLQKPEKNEATPWNKVDGIQAGIMAIDCLHFVADLQASDYETPGALLL